MRAVLQRVREASVSVGDNIVGCINQGILVFLGVAHDDTCDDADYVMRKIMNLRMFDDDAGKMNLSALETRGEILVVSQFTLYGDCKKGRRPSFDQAANPDKGQQLYSHFVDLLRENNIKVETGKFGAMMDVRLINDGPVTFILQSPK